MITTAADLGALFKSLREQKNLTQEMLAAEARQSRTTIAHLEQGRRIPAPEILRDLCARVGLPEAVFSQFTDDGSRQRIEFEAPLSELLGRPVSIVYLDATAIRAAENAIASLVGQYYTEVQTRQIFNRVLVFYGASPTSQAFFSRFLGPDAFRSVPDFEEKTREYLAISIRMFSTFRDAYEALNGAPDLDTMLKPLEARSDRAYRERTEWTVIQKIDEDKLPDLGYIATERVEKEAVERRYISEELKKLAGRLREDRHVAFGEPNDKKRSKLSSLMRKFGSKLQHDLASPLFAPDPDLLVREAEFLAPKEAGDIVRIAEAQRNALGNLAHYLTADHMDVYVATSMRSDADFVSVNRFVSRLFNHFEIRPLKLRHFNPTQSWIEDRVAKGLVEALMLRRADITVYMAQETDTFGKDSEASVALGQGKPVIVYVPKLVIPSAGIDTEELGRMTRSNLAAQIRQFEGEDVDETDETVDEEALFSRLLVLRLSTASEEALIASVREHWADFDLYGKADRIRPEEGRAGYRAWLDGVIKTGGGEIPAISADVRKELHDILISTSVRFERRAKVFREVHPLALQVILSTGVLNGILVSRSADSCAQLMRQLIINELQVRLEVDDDNYRLIEATTGSTIRVISRNELIAHAFSTFYRS